MDEDHSVCLEIIRGQTSRSNWTGKIMDDTAVLAGLGRNQGPTKLDLCRITAIRSSRMGCAETVV
jgi:hypothetical protein